MDWGFGKLGRHCGFLLRKTWEKQREMRKFEKENNHLFWRIYFIHGNLIWRTPELLKSYSATAKLGARRRSVWWTRSMLPQRRSLAWGPGGEAGAVRGGAGAVRGGAEGQGGGANQGGGGRGRRCSVRIIHEPDKISPIFSHQFFSYFPHYFLRKMVGKISWYFL